MQPSNFSWVIEDFLAGSSRPTCEDHYKFFEDQGIRHVVNLTEHAQYQNKIKNLYLHHIPIKDFEAPTEDQILEFLSILKSADLQQEATVIHCAAGIGRTGTMLTLWMMSKYGMNPEEALAFIRGKRPKSVETNAQEKFIVDFYSKHLKSHH